MLQKLDREQEFLDTDLSYLLQPAYYLGLLKRRWPYFLVPFASVLLIGMARVEGQPGHAGLGDEPPGQLDAGAVAGLAPGAQLHGHRKPASLVRRAGERHGTIGVAEQRRARSRLAHLRYRAAHVEVDQVGARLGHPAGGGAHDLRIVAEELHGHRPTCALVGVDREHLAARALVAVVDREARNHLREREPGAVALGLETHEPVADAGERREQHAVGDADAAEGPAVGEGANSRQSSVVSRQLGRIEPSF